VVATPYIGRVFWPANLAADSRQIYPVAAKLSLVTELTELIERCKAGDGLAFREVFRNHRADVARLVQRMTGRPGDLEDLVQEVFLQVYRSIKDFRGQSRFSTWLYRVTVNVVLMHRRAAKSRPVLQEAPEDGFGKDLRDLPDDQVARGRRVAAFYRLLDRLSDKKRAVFVLHELEGLSPSDVAKVVSAPVLTVRTRLFYARRELLEMLKEEPALEFVAREMLAESGAEPLAEREST
ncbi:MAG TPA: RNA polymerase sigma factor, partial [Polyangiaceae bacterium]|nr:RNA polymerase sigma factor [Polyangiaceae bacterium]